MRFGEVTFLSTEMKEITFIIFLIIGLSVSGQEHLGISKKAQKYFADAEGCYRMKNNVKALDLLSKAVSEDSCFFEAYLLTADIYFELDSTQLQVSNLEKAREIKTNAKLSYVLANAYYRMGMYEKAKKSYLEFLDKKVESRFTSDAEKRVKECDFAMNMMKTPKNFVAENMGEAVNTELDEYWPTLTIDGKTLIFTRLVPTGEFANELALRSQEDFFKSENIDGEWQEAEPMITINTMYNEGAQSISADGKLIFFTACTRSDGYGSCDIYFTRNRNGEWTKPQNAGAPVNSGSWESQPSISANGEYLYFVSNRQGGKGKMDIWRCRLKGFNTYGRPSWGVPENLGDSINTAGNEMSPYIHPDGKTLYFASDVWPGMGGTDIFYARLVNDSVWRRPVNMGYPINTYKDEQGLIVDADGYNAYYSSDRPGSKGLDIYRFSLYEKARPTPVSYVKGRVLDKKSNQPLCAQVELIDIEKDQVVAQTESCLDKGEFLMCLPLGKEYAFNVSRNGYLFYSENFSLKKVHDATDPYIMDIALSKVEVGSSAVLRNIFFQTDSYKLLDNSKVELERLIEFLRQNPLVEIEIGGHTDNVGSPEYNDDLSEKRAKSVFDYLMAHGISEEQLAFQGYGMSEPISSNETAEGRANNRRTEFKIVNIRMR